MILDVYFLQRIQKLSILKYSSNISRRAHLYNCLRPEFVKRYYTPLSPDAFSPMGAHNKSEHDEDIVQATGYLYEQVIPQFALSYEQSLKSAIEGDFNKASLGKDTRKAYALNYI